MKLRIILYFEMLRNFRWRNIVQLNVTPRHSISRSHVFLILENLMGSNKYLQLFANCIIVKGAKRSLLCDLQNEVSFIVSHQFAQLVELGEKHTIEKVKFMYGEDSHELFNKYITFLIDNNFAFYCTEDDRKLFPKLSLEWDYPASISNAVIEINKDSIFDFEQLFSQLELLGCRDIQLFVSDAISLGALSHILKFTNFRTVKSLQIFLPEENSVSDQDYTHFVMRHPRITRFIIYSAQTNLNLLPDQSPSLFVARIQESIDLRKSCGVVSTSFFSTTIGIFTESQKHNSCLNRKLTIDASGNIKNCLVMSEVFGNIKTSPLSDVVLQKDFTKYWNINKNQIEGCKDCEFRYICTDCRAYREVPDDMYSKPLKCGYDPNTSIWTEWSENPLKQKVKEFYGL